jgi:CO dehydrogenase maturation factor
MTHKIWMHPQADRGGPSLSPGARRLITLQVTMTNTETIKIALAGKGGVGKTTVAALVVEALRNKNITPVLAVDADPNSTLGEVLGMKWKTTVSDVLERTKGMRNIPDGLSKTAALEMQLSECIAESKGVDLLVMGHPEGPQCYCSANNVLREFMSKLSSNYRAVVLDNEAGMEHLNRRTTNDIDVLLIVSDPSALGLRTAKRIKELVERMTFLTIRSKFLIVNRVSGANPPDAGLVKEIGLQVAAEVPLEPEIERLNLSGGRMAELRSDSAVLSAIGGLVRVITA